MLNQLARCLGLFVGIGSIACLAMPAVAETPADLTVLSPQELQVVQRNTQAHGLVLVSGRVKPDCDKVEVRFSGKGLAGDLPDHWHSIRYEPAAKSFHERVKVPAGGWYKVEIRASKGGQAVGQPATVEKVGVGEVFVIAGQSNSTNSGEEKIKQSSGMVSSFSGTSWQIADDPQPGVHDKSVGGSPWPAFGDAMYAKFKVPIGIAATGHGGTSTRDWDPNREGDSLFWWTMQRVHQLGRGGFRALLWHQGETDIGMATDEYVDRLTDIIRASRKQAGWKFPWFVAKVSYRKPHLPRHENIREAHQRIWDDDVAFEGPDTDTLTGDNRDEGGNGVHFSPKGLKAHGEMWAQKVGAYIDNVFATP